MLEWSRDFCMFCGRRACLDWFQTWYMHSWSDFTVLINYWSRPSIRDQLSALLDCIIRLVWNWGQITEMHYLCLSPIKSLTQKWWMSRWPMCLIKRGHLTCRHIHPASLVILFIDVVWFPWGSGTSILWKMRYGKVVHFPVKCYVKCLHEACFAKIVTLEINSLVPGRCDISF